MDTAVSSSWRCPAVGGLLELQLAGDVPVRLAVPQRRGEHEPRGDAGREPLQQDALATGRCTLVPNAMAWKVLTETDRARATGILCVDRTTREAREIRGGVVVLCAQALESARILLNSKTRQHPNGLGNSSGVLGHYLMDHLWVAGGAWGEFPEHARPLAPDGPNRPTGSTSSASRAWERTRRPRSSTRTSRRTTCRTCS